MSRNEETEEVSGSKTFLLIPSSVGKDSDAVHVLNELGSADVPGHWPCSIQPDVQNRCRDASLD